MGVASIVRWARISIAPLYLDDIMNETLEGSQRARWRTLIKNKWFQWFLLLLIVSIALPYSEDNPLMPFALVYVILFPSFMFMGSTWKILRFNFFPSPVQLWKGFRRQWHAIEKGPVVVRVHRKKPNQSST